MALSWGRGKVIEDKESKTFALTYAFCAERAWRPPDSATPLSFWLQIAEIMSFLLMYHLFLYYQWLFQNLEKDWRKILEIRLFPQFLKMTKIWNIFSLAIFNILKEPLLVQKQTMHQQKAHDLSYSELEGQGRGTIRRMSHPLAVKAYFAEFYGRVFGFWVFGFCDIATPS